jgi:hypothetical protein
MMRYLVHVYFIISKSKYYNDFKDKYISIAIILKGKTFELLLYKKTYSILL